MSKKKNSKAPMMTKRNWVKEFKIGLEGDFSMLYGYMDCAQRVTPVLENMANKAENFEELKNELLKFTQKQKEFVHDVRTKRSSVYASKYGLPEIPY